MKMTDLEKLKSELTSQLVLLDSIVEEFIANSKPHVAIVRLEQWRNQTNEILLRLGKRETLGDIWKMVEDSTPADRILAQKQKYRAFVLRVMKEAEEELNQINDENQTSFACTD